MEIRGYKIVKIIKEADNRRVLSCTKGGKNYAIKEFSKGNNHQYYHEIYIIKQLIQHRNIIKLVEYFQVGENNYIVLEYCYKDLKEFLNENLSLSKLDRLLLFAQIVSAFKAIYVDLQTQNFTFEHRDIKPDNFMLIEGNQLKIIDFGESRITDDTDDLYQDMYHSTQICGTHGYMDPRMEYFNEGFSNKSDIWALGATLFFLMTNKELKIERSSFQIKVDVRKYKKGQIKLIKMDTIQQKIKEYLEEITHEKCKILLQNMLNMNLQERYDWEKLFKDKFVDELWVILNLENNEFRVGERKKIVRVDQKYETNLFSTFFYNTIGSEVTQFFKFIIRKGQLYLHTAQKMFYLFQYLKDLVVDVQLNWQKFEKFNYLLNLKGLYVFKVYSQMLEQNVQRLEEEYIDDQIFNSLKQIPQELFDRISLQIYYLFENQAKRIQIRGLESRIIQLQKKQLKEDEISEYSELLQINQEESNYFPLPNSNPKINREKLSLKTLSSDFFHKLFKQYLIQCLEVLLNIQENLLEKSDLVMISNLITCYEVENIPVGGDIPILNEKDIYATNAQIMAHQKQKFIRLKQQL